MNNREKLIALFKEFFGNSYSAFVIEIFAKKLIANGVVVREKGEWEEGEWTGEVRCYYWNRDYGNRSHLCEHTPLNCGTCHMNEAKNKRAKKCPVCGKQQMRKTNFCPDCGADMRKGEKG